MFREPLSELSAHLRNSTGAELVEEWEVTELETEQGRLRARGLTEVWEQAMHRGDRVTASGSFGVCSGTVEYVGKDYAVVVTEGVAWDVRLDSCAVTIRRSPHGGHTVTGGSRTLRAKLAEYEASGERVTAYTVNGSYSGTIGVAAADHVLVSDDEATAIPTVTIVAVSRHTT